MNDGQQKWEKILQLLKPEINEVSFESWFLPLKFDYVDENSKIFYILCDTSFAISTINNRYMHLLEGCAEAIMKEHYKIHLLEKDSNFQQQSQVTEISTTSTVNEEFEQELIINPRYSFDNFVVGPNNEYAYAASLAVAENPSSSYNPLYLYGESGLGKTHLMHAISNYVFNNHTNKKVLYVTGEMFTNEVISAIRKKKTAEFREKYRKVDLLLIDDVQFFKDKETVQEELFNTFNALYDNDKQIVLSSDRPPRELEIDERLRNRFGWNIVADIKKPKYETRIAILENKAELEGITITEDVQEVIIMIASRIKNNVRELEGAFTNIISMSQMLNKELTPQFAKENLRNIFSEEEKQVDVDIIKREVCKYFDVTIKDIIGKKRARDIAYPRQIAMYITRNLTELSYPKIGKAFGDRDHTTILHACEKIESEIKTNKSTKLAVETIEDKIKI